MNAQQIAIAERCLAAAHHGSMAFPEIIGTLVKAGFEGYAVDYRRNVTSYFLPDGDSVTLPNEAEAGQVAAIFDENELIAQIRWAQANPPNYSYAAFCLNARAAGCAGYVVSFLGSRVLYYGRTAETHIEYFPS